MQAVEPISVAPVQGAPDGVQLVTFYEDGERTEFALTRLARVAEECALCDDWIEPDDPAVRFDGDLFCAVCAW